MKAIIILCQFAVLKYIIICLRFVSSPEYQKIIILSCWSKKLIIFLNISAYVLYSCYTMKAAAILVCSTYYLVITGQKRIVFYAFTQNQTGTKFEVILDVYFIGCSFFYFFSEEKVQKSFFYFHCSFKLKYFLYRDQTRTSARLEKCRYKWAYYRRNLLFAEETAVETRKLSYILEHSSVFQQS